MSKQRYIDRVPLVNYTILLLLLFTAGNANAADGVPDSSEYCNENGIECFNQHNSASSGNVGGKSHSLMLPRLRFSHEGVTVELAADT
jgi:hypothetical protein